VYARAYGGGGEVCQVCHRLWKLDGRPILGWQTCQIVRSAKVCQVCHRGLGRRGTPECSHQASRPVTMPSRSDRDEGHACVLPENQNDTIDPRVLANARPGQRAGLGHSQRRLRQGRRPVHARIHENLLKG